MNTLKFKTDIKCSGCLEKVTPHLNEQRGIQQWEVDLKNPNKILSVNTDGADQAEIIAAVGKAGFKAEPVQ